MDRVWSRHDDSELEENNSVGWGDGRAEVLKIFLLTIIKN
jgi:hypothetical protein